MSNFVSAKENILLSWRKNVEGLCFIKHLETFSFQISRNYMLSVFGFIHLTEKSVVCTAACQEVQKGCWHIQRTLSIPSPFTLFTPQPNLLHHPQDTLFRICSLLQVITYRYLDSCVNGLICYNLLDISSNGDYHYYT